MIGVAGRNTLFPANIVDEEGKVSIAGNVSLLRRLEEVGESGRDAGKAAPLEPPVLDNQCEPSSVDMDAEPESLLTNPDEEEIVDVVLCARESEGGL